MLNYILIGSTRFSVGTFCISIILRSFAVANISSKRCHGIMNSEKIRVLNCDL